MRTTDFDSLDQGIVTNLAWRVDSLRQREPWLASSGGMILWEAAVCFAFEFRSQTLSFALLSCGFARGISVLCGFGMKNASSLQAILCAFTCCGTRDGYHERRRGGRDLLNTCETARGGSSRKGMAPAK